MTTTEQPPLWSSVHRPIPFLFDFYDLNFTSINNGGYAQFNTPQWYLNYVVGDKIKISAGVYEGIHTITSIVSANTFVTDAAYVAVTWGTLKHLKVPTFKLYSGYKDTEEYPVQLPNTLRATWTPEYNLDYQVKVDVSEYLKSAFRIVPPVEGIDFNMFTRFRISMTYSKTGSSMVITTIPKQAVNASIKTEDLMSEYVNNNSYLNTSAVPIVFGCGRTILSTLEGNVITNIITDNGDTTTQGDYSPNDYSSDYNIM